MHVLLYATTLLLTRQLEAPPARKEELSLLTFCLNPWLVFNDLLFVDHWHSSCGPKSISTYLEKQILSPIQDLLSQKFGEWSPVLCVLTSPLGNYNAREVLPSSSLSSPQSLHEPHFTWLLALSECKNDV